MDKLSDHFGKFQCMQLKEFFGIDTVQEAQAIEDRFLLKCPYIGPGFIKKLRSIKVKPGKKIIIRNTDVLVRGLTVRQRNALLKAFTDGLINELLNQRYMIDTFETDQIKVIPEFRQEKTDSVSYIDYMSQN